MKQYLLIVLCLVCLPLSQMHGQAQKNWKKGYFPSGIKKLQLGMPFTKLVKKHPAAKAQSDGYSFRTVLVEELNLGNLARIIYYVDNDGNRPVYETIFEYQPNIDVKTIATELYGPPNKEGEWWFAHRKGPPVNIWVYQQKLVIAAHFPNTEWTDE